MGERGGVERALFAVRPQSAGLIDHDVVASGQVDTVDVCAPALVVEKGRLHHAADAVAAVRQFPREVGQRATIVLAESKDDCSGFYFSSGTHDDVRWSNQEMESSEHRDESEPDGDGLR
jgi:hypothetical protein